MLQPIACMVRIHHRIHFDVDTAPAGQLVHDIIGKWLFGRAREALLRCQR